MIDFLIAAAAMAEAMADSSLSERADALDAPDSQVVIVKGRAGERWELPKLDYSVEDPCPMLTEGSIPGFGSVRFGPRCASKPSGEWLPFKN